MNDLIMQTSLWNFIFDML